MRKFQIKSKFYVNDSQIPIYDLGKIFHLILQPWEENSKTFSPMNQFDTRDE